MDFELIFVWVITGVSCAYIIIMAIFTYGLTRIRRSHIAPIQSRFDKTPPRVSVIIPVRNESLNIRNCLDDMLMQDFPKEQMEILVADDNSEDHTLSLVQLFMKQHPEFPVSIIIFPGNLLDEPGKKGAISRSVMAATGELVITTDADTRRGPSWISAMVKAYTHGRFQMLLGPVALQNETNLLQKIQSLELMGLIGTTAAATYFRIPLMCNGANLAYRRSAFIDAGGFKGNRHLASGDDVFLLAGIRKQYGANSIGFVFDRKASVFTEGEATFGGFLNQRLRWVSKSRGYKEKGIISMAVLTWLTHFLLLTGMLIGMFHPIVLVFSLGLWLGKILVEYTMVRMMSIFFDKKDLLGYYFIAQVFQLIYVVLIGISGNLFPYSWKGRKLRH